LGGYEYSNLCSDFGIQFVDGNIVIGLMVVMRHINFIFLIILMVLVNSCDEPDYLETYKTDLPSPSTLYVEQTNAFSLMINWRVSEEDNQLIDHFLIETFSRDDSITIDQDLFDSFITENTNARTILIDRDDSTLVETLNSDTIFFEYIDHEAIFDSWNYYRVTMMFDDIESFSILTVAGYFFELSEPEDFIIAQLNDFQLELTWDKSNYADGYRIVRFYTLSEFDSTFESSDSVVIDSSYYPQYDILQDSIYTISGIQPNQYYTYALVAYAEQDSIRRWSDTTEVTSMLSLVNPIISETKSVNDKTVRLYLPKDSIDSKFDTLFVLRKDDTQWACVETLMVDAMDQFLYESRNQYLISGGEVQVNDEAVYRLVAKGKVNALASNIVSGSSLDIEGFTFVEGGNFQYGSTDSTVTIDPFYISIYEFTGVDSFPSEDGNLPKDSISWVEAVNICNSLSDEHGRTFRLPSETEWEYVAKWDIFSQQDFLYPWQSNSITGDNANYMNSGDPPDNGLTPVGYYDGDNGTIDSFSPFGAYDMGGNILEWCGYGDLNSDLDEVSGNNYTGDDELKVLRGGGYWHDPEQLKTTNRFEYGPETQVSGFGFRIVMEDTE
jgi:hypothetical protein